MKPKMFVLVTLTGLLCAYVAMAYWLAYYTLPLIPANSYWRYPGLMGWGVL